jgi:hypothetical protein
MPRSKRFLRLIRDARAIAGNRDVLYLGTRCPLWILRQNSLSAWSGDEYDEHVWFTRSPEFASLFASLSMDDAMDEGLGAIFVFDRRSLRCRYRLRPFQNPLEGPRTMEERILGRKIDDLGSHLIGVAMLGVPRAARAFQIANRTGREGSA